jgi:hypothetical protein
MSVSVPGIISALSLKPMPPMLARAIANNLASLAAESSKPEAPAEGEAPSVPAAETTEEGSAASHLDRRA